MRGCLVNLVVILSTLGFAPCATAITLARGMPKSLPGRNKAAEADEEYSDDEYEYYSDDESGGVGIVKWTGVGVGVGGVVWAFRHFRQKGFFGASFLKKAHLPPKIPLKKKALPSPVTRVTPLPPVPVKDEEIAVQEAAVKFDAAAADAGPLAEETVEPAAVVAAATSEVETAEEVSSEEASPDQEKGTENIEVEDHAEKPGELEDGGKEKDEEEVVEEDATP